LTIELPIADCRALPIESAIGIGNRQSQSAINNRQSQSAIAIGNRQSQSAINNRQSAIGNRRLT
jgi:hypothetical protein